MVHSEGLTMLQSVSWSKNDPTLLIKWSNRAQNIASLQGCTIFSTDNLDCKNNLTIVKKEYGNYISKIVSLNLLLKYDYLIYKNKYKSCNMKKFREIKKTGKVFFV